MPDKLLNWIAPPPQEAGDDGVRRWRWSVAVAMYAMLTFMAWSLGSFAWLGFPGFARAGDLEENTRATQSLEKVVICTAIRAEITAGRKQMFDLQRIIEMEEQMAGGARERDRQQLQQTTDTVRDDEARFAAQGCTTVLQ